MGYASSHLGTLFWALEQKCIQENLGARKNLTSWWAFQGRSGDFFTRDPTPWLHQCHLSMASPGDLLGMFLSGIPLMEEILHQLTGRLSHYFQGFIHPSGAGFLPSTARESLTLFTVAVLLNVLQWESNRDRSHQNNEWNTESWILSKHYQNHILSVVSCSYSAVQKGNKGRARHICIYMHIIATHIFQEIKQILKK